MGYLPEQVFLNQNIFLHEKRIGYQYSRFLESQPTFTTYYSINQTESTTDRGLLRIEDVIGLNSPVRYNKIEDFPIYGIENIQLAINADDNNVGIDSTFDSTGIILPETAIPTPNDFFIITYLGKDYLFMVTEITYDTIKSNNYYQISYTLKYIGDDQLALLEKNVVEYYHCIFRNIGTEDKCIIRKDDFEKFKALKSMVNDFRRIYETVYYNKRMNVFILQHGNRYEYDPYLSKFIYDTGIFTEEYSYKTILLTPEYTSGKLYLNYINSIFYDISMFSTPKEQTYMFVGFEYTQGDIFRYYGLSNNTDIREIPFSSLLPNQQSYLDPILYDMIYNRPISDTITIPPMYKLLADYFNNNIKTINDVDIKSLSTYFPNYENYKEMYTLLPIVIFTLITLEDKFVSTNL